MADKALDPAMVQIEYNLDHPHNELLYWGVEGGLLPMLAIGGAGLGILWRLRRQSWARALGLLALITPMALHTQTEYPFYHSVAHWLTFLILLWFIDEACEQGGAPQISEIPYGHTLLLRFLAISIPLFVVPFMLTALHTAKVVTRYERGGYQQPDLLLEVVNPMAWLTRVEFDVNAVRLAVGMHTGNHQELQAYVDWGQEFVRHTPRANIYANMILALRAMGEGDKADALRQQALLLYPDEPLLRASGAVSVAVGLASPRPRSSGAIPQSPFN